MSFHSVTRGRRPPALSLAVASRSASPVLSPEGSFARSRDQSRALSRALSAVLSFGLTRTLSAVLSFALTVMFALAPAPLAPTAMARSLESRLGGSVPPASSPSETPEAPTGAPESGSPEAPQSPGPPESPESPAQAPSGASDRPHETRLIELAPLSEPGPLAADGAGQLFTVINAGGGYAIFRLLTGENSAEIVYRRKSAYATSLTLGYDGSLCTGLTDGVDCIDSLGLIEHYRDEALTHVLALALAPDGSLWVLRSASGGTDRLELYKADRQAGASRIRFEQVLTFRQSVQAFTGNGMVALSDGSVVLPVVENGIHRLVRVDAGGRLSRIGDYFQLSGSIVAGAGDTLYVTGVKRPQSLQEQQAPYDALYVQPARANLAGGNLSGGAQAGAPVIEALFPPANGESRLTSYMALGGDGELYLLRRQRVLTPGEPAREMPVLWRATVDRAAVQGSQARAIDFRIPYIEAIIDPRMIDDAEYDGPVMVAPGQPLIIQGGNFYGKDGLAMLEIGGLPSPIEVWTGDVIVVTVPDGVGGGEREVRVRIDHVLSDPETIEVKTADTPGWFQIGSRGLEALLRNHLVIVAYNARITVEGTTDTGERFYRSDAMEPPGYYRLRLPNGEYEARFTAAYVQRNEVYGPGGEYVGSQHRPVVVPEQAVRFRITDEDPIVVWRPEMFGFE